MGSRLSGLMVGPSIGTQSSARMRPLPSRALPRPSSTRPSIDMPIGRRPVSGTGTTRAPGAMPARAAHRHEKGLVAVEAHHLGLDLHRLIATAIDQPAATADGGAQAFGLQGQTDHAQQAAFDHRLLLHPDGFIVAAEAAFETQTLKTHGSILDVDVQIGFLGLGRLVALLFGQLGQRLGQTGLDAGVDDAALGLDPATARHQGLVLEDAPFFFRGGHAKAFISSKSWGLTWMRMFSAPMGSSFSAVRTT